VINREIDRCDVFILAMHRRWGQDAPDAHPYSSYTEEEFHRAMTRWQKKRRGKPQAPEIFVFFKHIDPGQMADPGPQLQKVLDFRKSLEESRQVLYHGFTNETEFKVEVDRHLRAFAKGELPKADAPRDKVLLPLAVLAEVQKEKAEKEQALAHARHANRKAEAAVARAEKFALEFAERASKAALNGRVEEARQDFAKATDNTASLSVLSLAFDFYHRTGDLETAEGLLERALAITGRDSETEATAAVLGNLGLIYEARGELSRAEESHQKSLAIQTKLGESQSIAGTYCNLGLIFAKRGELARAEEMFLTSLAISERIHSDKGMASALANLAMVYQARGEDLRAEDAMRKVLPMFEKLSQWQDVATTYGNLGLIYMSQGDLPRAEEMCLKALVVEVEYGHQLGIARLYSNLGIIYRLRGRVDEAVDWHRKALCICEKLRHQEGISLQYQNLGSLAVMRREVELGRELWTKARDMFAQIGMPNQVAQVQDLLNKLPQLPAKSNRASFGGRKRQPKKEKT
jgi:tetratricopeptide (TPR) repeat protein